jgi:ferric-dicitrate binding protein FerR (iron transport regulator)
MTQPPSSDQLREYAEKWLRGTISAEEKELFEKWYNEQHVADVYWPGDEPEDQMRQSLTERLNSAIAEEKKGAIPVTSNKRIFWRAAAVAAVLVISVAILKWTGNNVKTSGRINSPASESILDKTTNYTRHFILPDGSTVILRGNSKLDYSGNFSGNSREVILVGEAYFDIVHDEKRPFIIHTGEIKTTVLGTAFNINAYPTSKKITIAVTRGKVKVEKNEQLLAVLSPDQQVTYDSTEPADTKQSEVAATTITEWTKQDMAFEDISFEEVGELLGRRYNATINFKNPALRKCSIKAFFNGTEPLEKVIEVLCIISNANYTMTDSKNVTLDGSGCGD